VAEYLDSFSRSGQAGDLIAALNTLPAERLPSALDALSGVQHTHVQQLIRRLGTRFHQTLIARLPRGSHAAGPQRLATIGPLQGLGAAVEPGEHGAWIRAQGHQGSFEGDANAAGADYRGGGFTLGVDTAVGNAAMLGLSAGYTLSTLDSGRAALDIESAQLAAYGAWRGEHAYLGGSLSYGWHGVDSDRPVRVGTFEQSARADYHGDAVSADLEAGLPLTWSEYGRLTPFAGVSYSRFVRDGFSESGAGSANLSVSEDTDHSLLTRVGLRYGGTFETAGGTRWSPMAELAWLREHRDADSRITAGFDGIDGGFTAHGPELSRDRLRLAAGLSLEITSATRVELAYATERAGDQHADHLGLSLRHVW
jgi:outer membrane autotransporter protein